MAAVIALRPRTDRGQAILDKLEQRIEMSPLQVIDDGTRRYYLNAESADVDAFDTMLDKIDPEWHDHLTNWRGD